MHTLCKAQHEPLLFVDRHGSFSLCDLTTKHRNPSYQQQDHCLSGHYSNQTALESSSLTCLVRGRATQITHSLTDSGLGSAPD
jgi:hypothetical protein